jgi:uncharacterized protein
MIELTTSAILTALLSGAVIGLFLGTFGGGGSVLAAPLLLYAVGVTDPHLAIGTSAAAVSAIALVSLTGHWRAGRVKWPCATVFALAGIIGSLIGSSLALRVDGDVLLFAFAFAMAAIGLSMLRRPKSEGDPDVHITPNLMARIAPMGLGVGGAIRAADTKAHRRDTRHQVRRDVNIRVALAFRAARRVSSASVAAS